MVKPTKKKVTKAPAKKAAPKAVSKAAVKTAPKTAPKAAVIAAAAPRNMAEGAGCACPKRCLCWKKILIFVLGIVVGVGASCAIKHHRKAVMKQAHVERMEQRMQDMFVDGCLNMDRMRSERRIERMRERFGDKECITKDDIFGEQDRPARANRGPRGPRGEGHRGGGRGNRPAR